MQRISTINRAIDLFGAGKDGFQSAQPGVSDATYLSADWMNQLQESIVRVIEAAGLSPSADYDQFLAALKILGPTQLVTYDDLRAFSGPEKIVYLSGTMDIAAQGATGGIFLLDESDHSSVDDGGITVVTSGGARFKRLYSGSINPLWFQAVADGETNDSSIFARLESTTLGKVVDLQGKTYVVDKQPTGNTYVNGYFKRSSDSHVFQAGRNPNEPNRGAEITLKGQWSDSRYPVQGGLDGAIVVLGDSISHGAFVGNTYWNGWVSILKRMLKAETGNTGYGFTPWLTLGSGATLTQEVHDVLFYGSWVGAESTTGGADVLQGLSFTSSTVGDHITITCPTFQEWVRIWYIEDPANGTFSYSVNGATPTNVNTYAATRNVAKSILVQMVDTGSGFFQIDLKVVSGTVSLCGVGYESPPNAATGRAGNVVQNFSQSGRRLQPATEGMIDLACQGSVLILALGYNDAGDCAADAAYNAAFQQRIDWIIEYCLKYNTTLVVSDHCWWSDPSNPARQGLKRAATEARGIYVPLPDYLTRDQMLKTEYSDAYYMVSTLLKWVDTAHPNANGAKWIAETVAKAMGLSCTSKEQALAFHDYPWPLQFTSTSIFKNEFTTLPYLSTIHRNGNAVAISLKLVTKSNASIPAGTDYSVNQPLNSSSRQVQYFNTSAMDPYAPANLNGAGAVSTGYKVGLANDILIASYNPYLNTVNYGFSIPLDVSASKS